VTVVLLLKALAPIVAPNCQYLFMEEQKIMGNMIPYYQTLKDKQDSRNYVAVRFNDFEHVVLVEDWYCEIPACDCNDVFISFIVSQETRGLFSIRLDMSSWRIIERQIHDQSIKADKMITEFLDNLDEFKEVFKAHRKAVKQYGKKHYHAGQAGDDTDIMYYEVPGDIDANPFTFQYKDTEKYFITDQYCTNPGCTCHDVTLSFTRLDEDKIKLPEFVVRLDLMSLNHEVVRNSCDTDKTSDVMEYVLTNKPEIIEVLKFRQCEMKKDGGKSYMKGIAEKRSDPRIGRNDPCPCGSGKKYKRCCGLSS